MESMVNIQSNTSKFTETPKISKIKKISSYVVSKKREIVISILVILAIVLVIYMVRTKKQYEQNPYKINPNPIEEKSHLLEKPLNEFYVSSSHNSYLNFIQHASIVKPENIKNVLEMGAKCIEIDISYINNNQPVVAHGTKSFISTSFMSLKKMLEPVKTYGMNNSDPLIIFFEIYNPENKELAENIKKEIMDTFGKKISKVSNPELGNYIADKPIKHFLNKVILFGTMDKYGILEEIFYPSNNFINLEDTNPRVFQKKKSSQLGRIYKAEGINSFLSFNINFKPIWNNGFNLVSMNYQTKDAFLLDYLNYFKKYSYVHFSELT